MTDRVLAWNLLAETLFVTSRADVESLWRVHSTNRKLQEQVVSLANASHCTSSLWVALNSKQLIPHLTKDISEYLERFYELNVERNLSIRAQLLECFAALNDIDITPMPLKGAAYVINDVYADQGARFLSDIDILVPEARITDALKALARLGFSPAPTRFDFTNHHHAPTLVRSLDDVAVEIHSAPVHECAQRSLNASEMWRDGECIEREGFRWCNPSPTDAALLLFLHSEVVDECLARFVVDFRSLLDLRNLVAHAAGNIDWTSNLKRSSRSGAESCMRRYLNVYARFSGQHVTPYRRERWRDRAHFAVCRQAIRWPRIQRYARGLTTNRIKTRYPVGESEMKLYLYRVRAFGGMIRADLIGIAGRARSQV